MHPGNSPQAFSGVRDGNVEETFEVRNRYGGLIATAETLDMAKRDVRYRIANLGQSGLTVHRVTVKREVVYKPRLVTVLPS
jgi:hypothetical protein